MRLGVAADLLAGILLVVGTYGLPEPVDVFSAHSVRPPRTMYRTCLVMSTSISSPTAAPDTRCVAAVMASTVAWSAVPDGGKPFCFWKAITAWNVTSPYRPSALSSQ